MPFFAHAESNLNWVEGSGQTVQLGDDLAELKLKKDYVYLDGKDSMTFQKENGGVPSGSEIGAVFPMKEDQEWVLFFEYEESGHIADKDKDKIDANALLNSYKEGTEGANKGKPAADQLFIDGWEQEPKYDEKLHSLTWTILGHTGNNEKLVNYNVRLLTRKGYVSAVLVTDPAELTKSRATMEKDVLSAFTIKNGQRYEDFNPATDKKSEFGLAGLVLGGAGIAVAKKVGLLAVMLGLFKKFGIVIVAALAGVWRFLRGKKKKTDAETEQSQEPPADQTPGPERPATPPSL